MNTGLTHRIIPCLDVRDGRVVKGVRFKNLQDQGDPAESAARYAEQGADEIVFLDITASPEGRDADRDWIRRTAERVFIPLSVGGGVRRVEDAERHLRSGADKVGLNTAAIANPDLIDDLAQRFGSQCVVLSVDALGGWCESQPQARARDFSSDQGAKPQSYGRISRISQRRAGGKDPLSARSEFHTRLLGKGRTASGSPGRGQTKHWEVVTHGGRQPEGKDAIEWILEGVERGAGEILLTSIDADGTRDGYDLELLREVCGRVDVPVIASGGAGRPEHLADALRAGAAAVLAASIFHHGTHTVGEVKAYLAEQGFPMRIERRQE